MIFASRFATAALLLAANAANGKRLKANRRATTTTDDAYCVDAEECPTCALSTTTTSSTAASGTLSTDFVGYRHERRLDWWIPPQVKIGCKLALKAWCPFRMTSDEAFDKYFCGDGSDITLEETGMVGDVTDWWKAKNLTQIENDICQAMTANGCSASPASLVGTAISGVPRPPKTHCAYWIGGFSLTISSIIQDCDPSTGTDFHVKLKMDDDFSQPLSPIGINCELPGGTVFAVTHEWDIDIDCSDTNHDSSCLGNDCCGSKGNKCCGLDQCDGNLKCIDDVCMEWECYPNECTCKDNWIAECGSNLMWVPHEYCDDYVCAKNTQTGNCYCDPPGYTQPTMFP